MSQFTAAFSALYAAQTAAKGPTPIVATVGALAVAKPAILSGVPTDPAFADGTTA